ncbi:hypothetical protein [Salegentibacter sp. F14]
MKDIRIHHIKQNLILSCIEYNAFHFLPYLLLPQVIVDFPNKIRFYRYLKYTLQTAKKQADGKLELRIERSPWGEREGIVCLNFYDQEHQNPRINLQIKENDYSIFIDLQPF